MKKIKFEELNKGTILDNNDDHVVVEKDGLDIHLKIHLKPNAKAIVVFSNGAVNTSKKTPPVFMRSSWVNDMPYSAIYIDDRTLHNKNIRIGWGLGTKERHYLIDYSEIIRKICSSINYEGQDVYYFGSSAGGFMSMALATMHNASSAIVNNPQAYVFNYKQLAVKKVMTTCYDMDSIDKFKKTYPDRLSITTMFKKFKRTPDVYYLQNRLCESDMKNHVYPMMKMMDKYKINSKPINFMLYNDIESGHEPMSKEKTLKIIGNII
ncbi:hypothetical protein CD133_11200, partial [Staphylococcus massiliensis CCUG 55927]